MTVQYSSEDLVEQQQNMTIDITLKEGVRAERSTLPEGTVLMMAPQKLLSPLRGTIEVERDRESGAVKVVRLEFDLLVSDVAKLQEIPSYGLSSVSFDSPSPVTLMFVAKGDALRPVKKELSETEDIVGVLKLTQKDGFPYFLGLPHYKLEGMKQVTAIVEEV